MIIREFSKTIDIGDRNLGPGHPVYVIAEAGPNHNRDFDRASRTHRHRHHPRLGPQQPTLDLHRPRHLARRASEHRRAGR